MIHIALIQPDIIWEEVDANLNSFSGALDLIAGPVDVVLMPELFTTGFTMRSRELAEPMEGKSMQWMALKAAELKCALVGSIIIEEKGEFFNRLIWMQQDGLYHYYDKRHLFRMSGEHEHYTRGKRRVIMAAGDFRFRPLICYDLRFPVWSRNQNDYDILVYLANWPAPRRDVWASLLKARALENQAFVIGVNRVGRDGMGIDYHGESMVFDAKGRRIACMESDKPGVHTVPLSLEDLNAFRDKFQVWKDADPFTLVI